MRDVTAVLVVLAMVPIMIATGAILARLFDSQSTDCQRECVPVMAEDTGDGVICIDRAEEVKP